MESEVHICTVKFHLLVRRSYGQQVVYVNKRHNETGNIVESGIKPHNPNPKPKLYIGQSGFVPFITEFHSQQFHCDAY
jgi:hypothetical protein